MGLKNFMFNNSYAHIDGAFYSKQQSVVRFELVLFESDSKQNEIRRIPYQLAARRDILSVSAFVQELPEQPSAGDRVIVDLGDYATIRAEFIAFEKVRVKPVEVQTDENGQVTNQAELDAYTELMDTFDPLKEQNKRIATWDSESERWTFYHPADNTLIKCGEHKFIFRNNSWIQSDDVFDQEAFESQFGIDQMNLANNNLLALTYNWLKATPECANTVDV